MIAGSFIFGTMSYARLAIHSVLMGWPQIHIPRCIMVLFLFVKNIWTCFLGSKNSCHFLFPATLGLFYNYSHKKRVQYFHLSLFAIVNLAPTEWYLLRLGRMYGPLLVMSFFVAYMLLEYVEKNKINPRLFYPLLGLANFAHATFLFVSFGATITIAVIKWIKKESGIGRHLLLSFLTTLPVLGYYLCREGQLKMAMNITAAWIDGAPGLHWFKEMVYLFLGHQYPHTSSRSYPVDLIANLLLDLTLITIACFLLFSCLRLSKKFCWGLIGIFLLLQIKAILAGPMELVYLWVSVLKMLVPIAWILYGKQRPNKKIIFSQALVFILFL